MLLSLSQGAMPQEDGIDPRGGLGYSRYDRVRVERVWKETLNKESELRVEAKAHAGPPKYVMNLANKTTAGGLLKLHHSHSRLEIIADKVQKKGPQERNSSEGYDENGFEATAMKYLEKTPPQKWDLPCTRAQEIGWLIANAPTHDSIRKRQRSKKYPYGSDTLSPTGAQGSSSLARSSSLPTMAESSHLPVDEPLAHNRTLNNRKYYKPKSFGPETKYADTYMSLMHHDPFNQAAAGR